LIFEISANSAAGDQPELPDQCEFEDRWQVEEPEFIVACWVYKNYVTLQGDTDFLSVLTPEATQGMQVYLVYPGTRGSRGCYAFSRITNPGEQSK